MILKSTNKITSRYIVNERCGAKCSVTFVDLDTEEVVEVKDESGKVIAQDYRYKAYESEILGYDGYIDEHFTDLMETAKTHEYNRVADEVRAKRKKLLEDTDTYALSDRALSEAMKEYRQTLRDITKQEGFPYDVVFPVKPAEPNTKA